MSINAHPTLAAQLLGVDPSSDDRPTADAAESREAQLEKLEAQAAALLRAASRQNNGDPGREAEKTDTVPPDEAG